MSPNNQKNTLIIFDGTNIFLRSFMGLMRHELSAPDGSGTWGPFGAFTTVSSIIRKHQPTHVLIAFDKGKSTKRLAIDPEYKANRNRSQNKVRPIDTIFDHEYKPQLEIFFELCLRNGIPYTRVDGVEADDIIADTALRLSPVFDKIIIVSSDHDLQQLIRDNIIVIKPKISSRNIEEEIVTAESVKAEWGVIPERLPEIWSLSGDSGDNIKGVYGIGPKKAMKLISDYVNLEGVLSSEESKMQEHEEIIRKAFSLIKLDIDESIPRPLLGDLQFNPVKPGDDDARSLVELFDELGFRQIKDHWNKGFLWEDAMPFGRRLKG